MRNVKLTSYQKKFDHSYSFGVFPTLELLTYQPKSVIQVLLHPQGKTNQGVQKIIDLCHQKSIKTIWDSGLIKKIGGLDNTYAVGVFEKYTQTINPETNHIILVSPEDTGNLGTIIRTTLGFGISNIAIIKPAVDCFDPKTVRASMGAIFRINIEYFSDFSDYQKRFSNNLYLFRTDAKHELSSIKFSPPFSLVFGSESSGLSKDFDNLGTDVKISQSQNIDSLNLSIAVGIALYWGSKVKYI